MVDVNYTALVAGVAVFIGGILLIVTYLKIQKQKEVARSWPVVKGRIDRIKKTGKGAKVIGAEGDGYREYFLSTKYSYSVAGQQYEGTRILFGGDLIVKEDVDWFCERYIEGAPAQIIYDPNNPKTSLLAIDHPRGKDKAELFFGVILLALGVIIAVFNSGVIEIIK